MTVPIQETKNILKSAIPGPSWVIDKLLEPLVRRLEVAEEREKQLKEARPIHEWREEYGDVLWWSFPICEPPYCGTPLDSDWPYYHTHWTPILVPEKFV